MRRREFITLLGGATVVWPLIARAQQSFPVVGLLRSTNAEPFSDLVQALRNGLHDSGFEEGHNVAIEQRWANFKLDQLPILANELVQRRAAVIVGNQTAIVALRKMTPDTPGVFVTGEDPVAAGLVTSLNRPEGSITGITFFGGSQLNTKRMELLHELVPQAKVLAVLGDPSFRVSSLNCPNSKQRPEFLDGSWLSNASRANLPLLRHSRNSPSRTPMCCWSVAVRFLQTAVN